MDDTKDETELEKTLNEDESSEVHDVDQDREDVGESSDNQGTKELDSEDL